MSGRTGTIGLALICALAGCAVTPGWVTDRPTLPPCGEEQLGRGEGLDTAARQCLMDAWQSGADAELISTATSVEGDPITEILRVHADGVIEAFHDASQDSYGSGRWERSICAELMPIAEYNQPGRSMPDGYVFVPMGCEPVPAP